MHLAILFSAVVDTRKEIIRLRKRLLEGKKIDAQDISGLMYSDQGKPVVDNDQTRLDGF
ncbi:MAG: hypothetical protein ACETWM_19565 [Candidatus Lokiarchaeia archaeon]